MGYPEDLLEHAKRLYDLSSGPAPEQVDLRRAVSAAYYALFHLLTLEAAQNWSHERQRHQFARLFEHSRMRKCCESLKNRLAQRLAKGSDVEAAATLQEVADAFVQLQSQRHSADHEISRQWTQIETLRAITLSETAIARWIEIRGTEVAQDFLFDLMGTR